MQRIESVKNQKVKEWKKLQTKKGREQERAFLIEGVHLVEEALLTEDRIRQMIITEGTDHMFKLDPKDIPVFEVTDDVMKVICDTKTPQGIAAVCHMMEETIAQPQDGKFLLLDGIQDPGNMGTLIRTADSAGLDGVILGAGCVDLYNSKVIRATQGSLFHIPIVMGELTVWLEHLGEAQIPVFGTSLETGEPFTVIEPLSSFALVVGNEGTGVSKTILEQTTKNLYIPIYGHAESLNVAVAAGILLYHLRR